MCIKRPKTTNSEVYKPLTMLINYLYHLLAGSANQRYFVDTTSLTSEPAEKVWEADLHDNDLHETPRTVQIPEESGKTKASPHNS